MVINMLWRTTLSLYASGHRLLLIGTTNSCYYWLLLVLVSFLGLAWRSVPLALDPYHKIFLKINGFLIKQTLNRTNQLGLFEGVIH